MFAAAAIVPPVSIMSSTSIACLPSTSPITVKASTTLCILGSLFLCTNPTYASRCFAKVVALLTPPASGDITETGTSPVVRVCARTSVTELVVPLSDSARAIACWRAAASCGTAW